MSWVQVCLVAAALVCVQRAHGSGISMGVRTNCSSTRVDLVDSLLEKKMLSSALQKFRKANGYQPPILDIVFPGTGTFALSRTDKQTVKRALRDAIDLAGLAVLSVGSLVGREEQEKRSMGAAFYDFFARSYRSGVGKVKKTVAAEFKNAASALANGVAVEWAEVASSGCKCQDGGDVFSHALGLCSDTQRLGAFVLRRGGQLRTDGQSGHPMMYVCSWAVRQLDTIALVVLHEALHLSNLDIGDKAYGAQACKELAATAGGMPLLNADSYVEYLLAILASRHEIQLRRQASDRFSFLYKHSRSDF